MFDSIEFSKDAVFDMEEERISLPPIPLTEHQLIENHKILVKYAEIFGLTVRKIFAIDEPNVREPWEIPARFVKDKQYYRGPLFQKTFSGTKLVSIFQKLCKENRFDNFGVTTLAQDIRQWFGARYINPLVFGCLASDKSTEDRRNRFCIDYAILASGHSGTLIQTGSNFMYRLRCHLGTEPVGLIGSYRQKMPEDLAEYIYSPRGMVFHSTYDVYDMYRSAIRPLLRKDQWDEVYPILAWCKLEQSPDSAYTFQQKLRQLKQVYIPMGVIQQPPDKDYQPEALEDIKETWYGAENKHGAAKALYRQIVPRYLTYLEYKNMFKVSPADSWTALSEQFIGEGLIEFEQWFNKEVSKRA